MARVAPAIILEQKNASCFTLHLQRDGRICNMREWDFGAATPAAVLTCYTQKPYAQGRMVAQVLHQQQAYVAECAGYTAKRYVKELLQVPGVSHGQLRPFSVTLKIGTAFDLDEVVSNVLNATVASCFPYNQYRARDTQLTVTARRELSLPDAINNIFAETAFQPETLSRQQTIPLGHRWSASDVRRLFQRQLAMLPTQ